jgi:hypothetical protein
MILVIIYSIVGICLIFLFGLTGFVCADMIKTGRMYQKEIDEIRERREAEEKFKAERKQMIENARRRE